MIVVTSTVLFAPPDGTPALTEKQNLIYREAAAPSAGSAPEAAVALAPVGPPIGADAEDVWTFRTDPTLLMRFSAATANAHRIHYDWPYATGVEGYPGLVVHGPLMTLSLAEAHRLSGEASMITELRHRNAAPLFCGQSATLRARRTDGGKTIELFGPKGVEGGPGTVLDLSLN